MSNYDIINEEIVNTTDEKIIEVSEVIENNAANNHYFSVLSSIGAMMNQLELNISEMMRPIIEYAASFQVNFSGMASSLSRAARPLVAVDKLGEAQFVFWEFLPSDLIDTIIESKNINKTMREFLMKDRFKKVNETVWKCNEHSLLVKYKRVFSQSISAYESQDYDLAAIGFLSIIDGLLSDVSGDSTAKIYKRADTILKIADETDIINDYDISIIALAWTFRKTIESLCANFPFLGKEPKLLNRHWIMHGRSHKKKTKLDCIKLINLIYGILIIDEFNKTEKEIMRQGINQTIKCEEEV